MTPDAPFKLEYRGFCPICECPATFRAGTPYLRDSLFCTSCPNGSLPRERALALVLRETEPKWRRRRIHEAAPVERGISHILRCDCRRYVETQFYPDRPPGEPVGAARNENLERQSFADASFDLVIALDVLEHVARPALAIAEIHRTLRPGGAFLATFPIGPSQERAVDARIGIDADGAAIPIKPELYHGSPVDPRGTLVTMDYGYNVHRQIAEWAPFDVRVYRFADRTHGILGELTDVVLCRKT